MTDWPPDYVSVFAERERRYKKLVNNPVLQKGAREYYSTRPIEFIEHWGITYDPRNAGSDLPATMPFIMFPRQHDLILFLQGCLENQESGLIEKSRDMGATWVNCAYTWWLYLFSPGVAVGWGSRKEFLVDRIGDPDSIFEKIRLLIRYTPNFFLPAGFSRREHMSYMKILNPETGATITGEAGDNIGRGGRKKVYFKDESAHYGRPELIEAALGDNTNCQIDFSSVNGTANIFYRRRQAGTIWEPGKEIESGKVRVMIMDWRDHPAKDQAWHDRRRGKAEAEGLLTLFNQEVERDYAASVEGVIIPSKWIRSAIDAHKKLNIEITGSKIAGLDVADEGGDKNAYISRHGILMLRAQAWGEGDTTRTAERAVQYCREDGITELEYDCIGVGAGVKGETNRMKRSGELPKNLKVVAWSAAAKVLDPENRVVQGDIESPKNKDFFENLKSQGWWELRRRFELTHKAVTSGQEFRPDDLISIPAELENRHQLETELSQPTFSRSKTGKIIIDKKPNGSASPNYADSCVMAYWPVQKSGFVYF
jgi:hypothetical protein